MLLPDDASPLVFLDVDGVCHPLKSNGLPLHASLEALTRRTDDDLELSDDDPNAIGGVVEGEFLEENMRRLAELVHAVGAHIVLSSTWRETAIQRRAIDAQLRRFGMPSHVGCTPRLPTIGGGGRHAEIMAWVAEHCADGDEAAAHRSRHRRCWVAIDDLDLKDHTRSHFVKTDLTVGLDEASSSERSSACVGSGCAPWTSTAAAHLSHPATARRRKRSTLGLTLSLSTAARGDGARAELAATRTPRAGGEKMITQAVAALLTSWWTRRRTPRVACAHLSERSPGGTRRAYRVVPTGVVSVRCEHMSV